MKKQTFISFYYTDNNQPHHNYADFNRWSLKRPETILKKLLDFINDPACASVAREWNIIKIYATPDGYNTEESPVLVYDVVNGCRMEA